MAIRVRSILKGWFSKGKYPTGVQFSDMIDSFYHKSEDSIKMGQISGLQDALDSKAPVPSDDNTNPDTEISEFPGSAKIQTSEVEGFDVAIITTAFVYEAEAVIHEFHVNNTGGILIDNNSYRYDDLEGYELSCVVNSGKAILTITFNCGPGTITVKKPIIRYI